MKKILTCLLLLSSIGANAQDCTTSLLFKKGAVLTYKNYMPVGAMVSINNAEMTRLVYTVKEVKDSNNKHYSYITKKGTNPKDAGQQYEKNYVVMCDGTNIFVPVDFYTADTIYFSNQYPDNKKDKGYYSGTTIKGDVKYQLPVDAEKGKVQLSSTQINTAITLRDYERVHEMTKMDGATYSGLAKTGRIVETTYTAEGTVSKFETSGDETLNTGAGTYQCKKITMVTAMEIKGLPIPPGSSTNTNLYYNAKVGLVRIELALKKKVFGYIELQEVKQ